MQMPFGVIYHGISKPKCCDPLLWVSVRHFSLKVKTHSCKETNEWQQWSGLKFQFTELLGLLDRSTCRRCENQESLVLQLFPPNSSAQGCVSFPKAHTKKTFQCPQEMWVWNTSGRGTKFLFSRNWALRRLQWFRLRLKAGKAGIHNFSRSFCCYQFKKLYCTSDPTSQMFCQQHWIVQVVGQKF